MKKVFFWGLFFLFLGFTSSVFAQKQYVVVLDAGHGGKDPGNEGNGYQEKKIALKVVLAVGKALEAANNVLVVYTRDTDDFVELHNRAKIANKKNADLFVSIHCDSHTSNAHGAGTFVLGLRGNKKNFEIAKRENSVILLEEDYQQHYDYDPSSPESMIGLSLLQEENLDKSLTIASLIQSNVSKNLRRLDRKVKQDNFLVLRNTVMPSVLVELGFLTNKNEGRYLNSAKGQKQMAKEIAGAILKYVAQLALNTVAETTTIVAEAPVEFKVQLASGKNKVATKSYNFKGLTSVQRVKVGAMYKYYFGNTSSYTQVKKALKKAKSKGFSTAFIVAFKNGEKIAVSKVLKM